MIAFHCVFLKEHRPKYSFVEFENEYKKETLKWIINNMKNRDTPQQQHIAALKWQKNVIREY